MAIDPDALTGAGADPEQTLAPSSPAPTANAPITLLPGTKLGSRYTILRLLGRGGMGAVYQAFDDELLVAVAIKTILPDPQADAGTRRDQEGRFKRELLLARQVTHKNVVRIHDLGEFEGLKYITMTYVEGETLAALVRRVGALPIPQVMATAKQVIDGLAAAHEAGVVHRDLKPENIMVTPDGQALIMDFGIARSTGGTAYTQAGVIIGTLEYMSPEQAGGEPVDARTDVYSMGLMIYDMLLGRPRLQGRDHAMSELMERLQRPLAGARTKRPEVPDALEAVVARAVSLAAADRYANGTEMAAAFDELALDGHRRQSSTFVAPAATVVTVTAPARPRWPVALAGLALAAAVVGGTWLWSARAPVAPAGPREPVSVLVANFENRTGDPVFDGVVEQALGLGIESASFVTAYPRRDALRVAATIKPGAPLDEQTARLVALREGVTLVLSGSVAQNGGHYRISAHALSGSADTAAPLYSLQVDADGKATVLDAVGRLAGDVRQALGDTAVPRGGPAANETFTAASLEAARAYATAQELQWAGKVEDAIAQYRETVRLDPDMGRAYSGLAAQFANLARTTDAEENYQKALARIDRMTDREKLRTRGSYYLFARKPEQAIQEFTTLVTAYPADSSGLTNLALARFYQRDMAQALEQGRRAAAIFPKNVLRRSNVALYAMYAGQFDTAITETRAVHELNPTHLKAFVARALSELALDRASDAIASYQQVAATSPAGASFAAAGVADTARYQGRLTDAANTLEKGIAGDVAAKNATAAAGKHVALAEVRLAQGDLTAAVREATQATTGSDADTVRAGAGLVLAEAGRAPAAQALAALLEAKLEADPQAHGRLIRATLALAQNQSRPAVEFARQAQKLADTWLGRVVLGRAYLANQAFPEAYAELEAAIKRKGEATAVYLDDVPSYRYMAPVYYYLGLAQQGLKSPAAADSFKTFLHIKQNGDEQGLVADARRRVATP